MCVMFLKIIIIARIIKLIIVIITLSQIRLWYSCIVNESHTHCSNHYTLYTQGIRNTLIIFIMITEFPRFVSMDMATILDFRHSPKYTVNSNEVEYIHTHTHT